MMYVDISHSKKIAMNLNVTRIYDPFQVEFPFLVLLVSGGHSLLAVAHTVDRWSIIGKTVDDAPGEALDKVTSHNFSSGPLNLAFGRYWLQIPILVLVSTELA